MLGRTVSAVSTPRGKGGIAVIRISGADAVSVAERFFLPAGGRKASQLPERYSAFGKILDSENNVCDTGICTVYKAPRSFTGEDMVEISCHGGAAVTREVLLSSFAHGADPAEAGEFTRRAFINGKLSLTEAEAVGLLIDADTTDKLKLAGGAARGNVTREIERLSAQLLDVMTALYAAIDYPEEDVGDEGERKIYGVLKDVSADVRRLLDTYKTGRAVQSGVKCAICGRPNVGKSSLFNMMVGAESAIVTDIAGTTRDVLRETVAFGGVTLLLADTAGIRSSGDTVEMMGIDRARGEIDTAELIISVWNSSEPLTEGDRELLSRISKAGGAKLAVFNKTDLPCALTEDEIREISDICGEPIRISCISCAEDSGISELSDAVARIFGSDGVDLSSDAVIWDVRHRRNLTRTLAALESAILGLESGDPIDAVCTTVEEAMSALSETDGRGVEETIVGEIFARFCVGK